MQETAQALVSRLLPGCRFVVPQETQEKYFILEVEVSFHFSYEEIQEVKQMILGAIKSWNENMIVM